MKDSSWAVELVGEIWREFFRKKEANEAALDAGEHLPYPEVPVMPRQSRYPRLKDAGISPVFANKDTE
jgi:hypothetical protein